MEITQTSSDGSLIICLVGRLDAGWSPMVQKEFDAAVRRGEHDIRLDMSGVTYISSAGLRVVLTLFKNLRGIGGSSVICAASPLVRSALQLAGLEMLMAETSIAAPTVSKSRTISSPNASYEVFSTGGSGISLSAIGNPETLKTGGNASQTLQFGENILALGIGALGADSPACDLLFGEFLAVAGVAAYQPSDGSRRPDFAVTKGDLRPEGRLMFGLLGKGTFPLLVRFESRMGDRGVVLSELIATALELSGAPVAAIAAVTETDGLVGASLRQTPAPSASDDRFAFPNIRDWLAFGNERMFRDSSSLLVGVAAREDSKYQEFLRPLAPKLFGHFHAVAFPYRPLRKGLIKLEPTVAELFDGPPPQAVLHLLTDTRDFNGIGESEFLRGALWISPITITP